MKNSISKFFAIAAVAATAARAAEATEAVAVADHAGRCWWAEVRNPPPGARRYVWNYPGPDGARARSVTDEPRIRRRMPEGTGAFPVRLEIEREDDTPWRADMTVKPPEKALVPPFPENDVTIGICGYDNADRLLEEIVTNRLCNLYVHWVDPSHCSLTGRLSAAVAAKGHEDGLRVMTIYGHYGSEAADALRGEFSDRYLGNNIGEMAGYLYQRLPEARAAGVPQNLDTSSAIEDFAGRFVRRGPGRDGQPVPYVFSTSGSPLACYELMGGIDFICNELYAVGSANLAYATSEARGAARRWRPAFWGSWLAEEWQTFPLPYGSDRKYELLEAGMLQQWVMGTSLMVLESGAQSSQAHAYTALDPVLDPEGKKRTKHDYYHYDELPPRRYRETVKKVFDFVRTHKRDPGGPDVRIALALGAGDAFVGMTTDWFAVWGQHEQARTNSNWRCGAPEATWKRVQETFFPCPRGALAPLPNYWLAGSPYGQVDVVQVDGETRLSDLSRYKMIAFAGWNSMTEQQDKALVEYARHGGVLALCVPHLSSRRDREWRDFGPEDLLPCPGGIRVTGRPETVRGRLSATAAAPALLRSVVKAVGETELRVAPLRMPPGAETLVSIAGKPLVVRVGGVHLLAAWDFPGGDGPLSDVYDALLRALAAAVPQPATIAPVPGEKLDGTRAVCFAVYQDHVYLLNIDCANTRSIMLSLDGAPARRVDLRPLEVWSQPRKGLGRNPAMGLLQDAGRR